ncbi:MAG: HEAT repeat domain-containing protein [Acidobacteria bacterium]|nr:HEAT repeat domain-containing protein [Acidobacteriota bacterium]
MGRLYSSLLVLAIAAGAAGFWYYRSGEWKPVPGAATEDVTDGDWLDRLRSQNPRVAEDAAHQVTTLGVTALPEIQGALGDPAADPLRKKASLKACGILGPIARPALDDVAAHLPIPDYTLEAAVALSFMGRDAFPPLRDALASDDPIVRRESLRSLGKLRERAPLDPRAVVPLLLEGIADPDPGVRVVAATYLGILHEDADEAVPALIAALLDEHAEVRTATAEALGSFGAAAEPAIPALRKAAGDRDENVAREAGLALVKLQK